MSSDNLLDRLRWVIIERRGWDVDNVVDAIIKEIETTHSIVDAEEITEEMLDACHTALPEHYDPPDPKRRAWHSFKAKRRFTAMVKAVKKRGLVNK